MNTTESSVYNRVYTSFKTAVYVMFQHLRYPRPDDEQIDKMWSVIQRQPIHLAHLSSGANIYLEQDFSPEGCYYRVKVTV